MRAIVLGSLGAPVTAAAPAAAPELEASSSPSPMAEASSRSSREGRGESRKGAEKRRWNLLAACVAAVRVLGGGPEGGGGCRVGRDVLAGARRLEPGGDGCVAWVK